MPPTIIAFSCARPGAESSEAATTPRIVLTQSGLVRAVFATDEREDADRAARFWAGLYGSAVTKHLVDVRIAVPPPAGSAFRSDEGGWRKIGRIQATRSFAKA